MARSHIVFIGDVQFQTKRLPPNSFVQNPSDLIINSWFWTKTFNTENGSLLRFFVLSPIQFG